MVSFTPKAKLPKQAPSGEVVDVNILNNALDKIDSFLGAFECTSTTRPNDPFPGMLITETDTSQVAQWNGTRWVYLLPGVYNIFKPSPSQTGSDWDGTTNWVADPDTGTGPINHLCTYESTSGGGGTTPGGYTGFRAAVPGLFRITANMFVTAASGNPTASQARVVTLKSSEAAGPAAVGTEIFTGPLQPSHFTAGSPQPVWAQALARLAANEGLAIQTRLIGGSGTMNQATNSRITFEYVGP